jgi:hypothetical protein
MGFLVYELNCQYNNEDADEMILPLFPAPTSIIANCCGSIFHPFS